VYKDSQEIALTLADQITTVSLHYSGIGMLEEELISCLMS